MMNQKDADEFEKAAKKITKENTRNKFSAIKTLVRLGTHLPDGSLHPNYGGDMDKEQADKVIELFKSLMDELDNQQSINSKLLKAIRDLNDRVKKLERARRLWD